jgi:hypothetical protein
MQQLETVLPQPGGRVLIVRGPRRGHKGVLDRINEKDYNATISIAGGQSVALPYEDFCKFT